MSADELQQIRMVFQGLQTLYQTHLPKIDPRLIHDLLVRELDQKSEDMSALPPFYIVEIRTVKGTDQEKMKSMIFRILQNSSSNLYDLNRFTEAMTLFTSGTKLALIGGIFLL